ncbi:hypothetical protein DYB38_004987 [Aphanomyces astaci]|uniref:Glucosyltransferase 24 catalytic domain-containing protein n=1 Tax=Aphanomyces astaci TaxID=112090 RepID=A0A397D3Q5_APHAT|nr:hypothetical protein DYB38_004987 [Aphanomyces astaci]
MAAEDPLKRLQLLSQNFPKYASSLVLASKPVPQQTIDDINHARSQRLYNRIVVNGLPVDFNEYGFNAFDFLKSLNGELRLADTLAKLDPTGSIKAAMGSLSSAPSDVRISLRGPVDGDAPLYLNSIETDEETAEWPTDLGSLRGPSWSLIYLRKTMYELILVVDPTTKQGINAMNEERATYAPSVEDKDVATVFHVSKMFLAARANGKSARDKYLREVLSLNDLTVKEVLQIYSQAVGERYTNDDWLQTAKAILTDGDNDGVWAMTNLVAEKNLPINSQVFNGVVRKHVNVQEDIMTHFARDQPLYQTLVRANQITDDSDMLSELLGNDETYAVFCPWFDPEYKPPTTVVQLDWNDPVLRLMSKKPEADAISHARLFVQLRVDASSSTSPDDEQVLSQLSTWLFSAVAPPFSATLPSLSSLQVLPDQHVIYVNGRPLELVAPVTPSLFDGLVTYESATRSKAVSKAYVSQFKHNVLTAEDAADKTLQLNVVLSMVDSYLKTPRVAAVLPDDVQRPTYSYVTPSGSSSLDVVAYLDPLSDTAQRASGILRMLHSVLHAKITLVLVPPPSYDEFPLKRFYRFLWGGTSSSLVEFDRLPRHPVLTLNIETPELWNVQMVQSDVDIDNIQQNASATFTIKDVLVYGQCVDKTNAQYPTLPNGLQLVLERSVAKLHSHKDTVVMKNLGYFQLQAAPVPVIVYDFLSKTLQLEVKKQPGQEGVRLLDDGPEAPKAPAQPEETSVWTSLVQWGAGSSKLEARKGDTIHVFSLATGHLYERMLKLMMLSVLKRTNNPVTFWLLENFLSPDFKNSVAALQAEFGMDIRLVTYKWPNWLRRQTDKQRIIWGYKILFLDVLFPLGVDKIIYVDADQVVRADLKELWTMDLQGKAYGYTPFCDSLRAIYDQLSADPNSLSNLDQDLPNYAQHQIPIFSLPQEWLWCESWCSDESKAEAKTIDLCNNPKHKEPKLDMAKRVISGDLFPESWLQLDAEVKAAEAAYELASD